MHVRQSFLHDAEQRRLSTAGQTMNVFGEAKVSSDAASFAKTFDIPFGRGSKSGFVEQWRVQEMRKRSSVGDGAIHQLLCVAQMGAVGGEFLGEHVEADFGGGQVLSEAVVKFAGDAAAFLVLHAQ